MVKRKKQQTSSAESGSGDEGSSCSSESESGSYGESEYGSSSDGGSENGSSYGGSENSSSYGGSDSGSASMRAPKIASFSLSQVLFGDEDSDSEDAYQSNGKSAKRVRKALKTSCCARRCKRQLAFKTVMCLVVSFWALSKSAQDALLWSLQHPMWTPPDEDEESSSSSTSAGSSATGSKSAKRVVWYLEGGVATGCQACNAAVCACVVIVCSGQATESAELHS